MSKKKKYALMGVVAAVNLLVIIIVRDWDNLSEGRLIAPFRQPSRSDVTRWAAEIERRLNEGDIDFVIDRYDGNAQNFFSMGVTNWVDQETNNLLKEMMRTELTGVKSCRLKTCDCDRTSPGSPNNFIEYELIYENGRKLDGFTGLFKNKRGGLGVASFGVPKPENFERIDELAKKNVRQE